MPFYSVRTEPARGIYTSWYDCKNALNRCKDSQHIAYKKFDTEKEANEFLNANRNRKPKYRYSLYVDGSYNKRIKKAGYAAILIDEKTKKEIDRIFGVCEWYAKSWNIDGELTAVARGIKMVLSKENIDGINIYFDYEGIRSFAKGWYSTEKCDIADKYVRFLKIIENKIKIHFIKIKSHSNNHMNDKVDKLAKKSLEEYNSQIKLNSN